MMVKSLAVQVPVVWSPLTVVAPCRVMPWLMFSVDVQLAVPAGIRTVSPGEAAATAALTSARETEFAFIMAPAVALPGHIATRLKSRTTASTATVLLEFPVDFMICLQALRYGNYSTAHAIDGQWTAYFCCGSRKKSPQGSDFRGPRSFDRNGDQASAYGLWQRDSSNVSNSCPIRHRDSVASIGCVISSTALDCANSWTRG